MGYRSRDSYISKDPSKRANQLANLSYASPTKKKVTKKDLERKLPKANIIEFANDFLHISFKARPAQEVILRSIYGLPLSDEQLDIYTALTGSSTQFEPEQEKTEAVLALGARSGKSLLASIIALFEATARAGRYRSCLNKGETGYVIVVATRLQQARQIIGASCARLMENSTVSHLINESYQQELRLTNGMSVISLPCNSTAGRGLPIICLILDELGWYRLEGPKADEEIFRALRPRMSQFIGAKFVAISTPSAKQGLLWDLFDEGPQVPSRLTVNAPTLTVNPLIDKAFIDSEYRRDPDNAEREFGAVFAEQVDAFFPADKLLPCFILSGDLPYDPAQRYHAAIDQSGLSGRDRFAFAVTHNADGKVTVDVTRTWDTTDADAIITDIAAITNTYQVDTILIDRYALGWVKSALEKRGLAVEVRDLLPVVYSNLKRLVIAGRVELPDRADLREGLLRTQAFYGRSNTLSISHERNTSGHGDLADAVTAGVWVASKSTSNQLIYV